MASIFVSGDIFHPSSNLNFIGEELLSIIKGADYSIGNLEGVELLAKQEPINNPYQAPGTIRALKKAGFDLMLLANNHITDFGRAALQYTLHELDSNNIDRIGAGMSYEEAYAPLEIEINGLKFAFINICEAQLGQYKDRNDDFGYAWMGYPSLMLDIRSLSQRADFTIVFAHLGLEHYELPLPEVREFYQQLCDNGASCVIGSHPHIAQGYEFYGKKFIAYSLGNFYFPRTDGSYKEENNSYSLMLDFFPNGEITANPIFHSLKHDVVDVETKNPINISYLCNILKEEYKNNVDEQCVKAYRTLCFNLLLDATCGDYDNSSFKYRLKSILKLTLLRNKYITRTQMRRDKLLLRLFENESYRWTIIRALKQITK